MNKTILAVIVSVTFPMVLGAQQVLTLEDCRQMAVQNNNSLQQSATKVEMAHYDKLTAVANYFPKISATGAYLYNTDNVSLVGDDVSAMLRGSGTAVQGQFQNKLQELTGAIMSNPAAAAEYAKSPMWQTVLGALSQTDLSTAINGIGAQIDDALHLDIKNVYVAAVSLQQPVFMGGKIVASNQIAALAEDLARAGYDAGYQQVIVDVDQAYWQIVSIAAKKELAEAYADLLHTLEHDVAASIAEGVSTRSDELSVKVKANEADMLLTKSSNGLRLAKMLLCKQLGLPLDSDIRLADEGVRDIPMPAVREDKPMEQVYEDRAELRSLSIATQIYDKKVAVARADMLPAVALTANYLYTNPNVRNGFENKFGGMFNAGVMVSVPIFHGFEAVQKTRKAKAEASLFRLQREDALRMVDLQITQLRDQRDEAYERLAMAKSNLDSAEENLRVATVGFEEGVVESSVTLAAQSAWLQAHSEYIDAGIELRMNDSHLGKAEGYAVPTPVKASKE